MSLYKKR